jgi:glycosyltransferase involved in cell wall biosynthesis
VRIAFVGGFGFKPKGTIQSRAYPLATELVAQGHEVTIFVAPYDNPEESGQEWVQEGVRIKGSKTGTSPLRYPGLLARLIHAVKKYRPDVVHIFKPKGFAGAAGMYLGMRGMRIALDCDDWEGWGGFNDIKPYPWLVKEYIDRQERWMMRSTRVVTVASRWLLERVCQVRGNSTGVFYLPNCGASAGASKTQEAVRVQSQAEAKRDLGLPKGLLILYSGHFQPGDNTMFFCRAAAAVAERNQAAIIFVGDGPDLPKIKDFVSQHPGLKTYFYSQLPYDQFVRIVWASDVTAFPFPNDSVHRAKCSVRIIDYMAMGKPVITSEVGQNMEYIVDGESGILAPPDDENAFADKLEKLLRNPDLRARLGQNAERRVREKFRWSGGPLQECLAAYHELTAGSPSVS